MVMKKLIIGVSCENFEIANKAYKAWLEYLLDSEPECVEDYNEYALYVDIDKIFRYTFFDYRMEEVYSKVSDQLLYQDEFFFLEGVEQPYWKYNEYFSQFL